MGIKSLFLMEEQSLGKDPLKLVFHPQRGVWGRGSSKVDNERGGGIYKKGMGSGKVDKILLL